MHEHLSPLSPRLDGAAHCRLQRRQRVRWAARKSHVCWCRGRKWSETLESFCWEVKFQWRLRVADQHLVVSFSQASCATQAGHHYTWLPVSLNKGRSGPPPPHRPQFAALFPATWLFGVADSVDTCSMTGWSGPLPHPSRAMIGLAASWCTLTSRAQVTEVGTLP